MRKEVALFFLVSVAITKSQNFNLSIPEVSPEVMWKMTEGVSYFIHLWFFSLKVDKQPQGSNKTNLEPKTFLLPCNSFMLTLVNQAGHNPLYEVDDKHSELRRKFILDHLVLNPIMKNDPALDSPNGLTEKTLSNKPVTIRREKSGDLYVEGVRVIKIVTLLSKGINGSRIYVLKRPLFNQAQIIQLAFKDLHQSLEEEKIDSSAPASPPLNSCVFYLFCIILYAFNFIRFLPLLYLYIGFIVSV